jgi:ketosteroid isomerase-like protein
MSSEIGARAVTLQQEANTMSTSTDSTKAQSATVDQLRAQHIAAINAGDIDAAVSIFAPHGILLPPGSPALRGSSAIRGWFTAVLGPFRFEGFDLAPNEVEQSGDLYLEHGAWKATMQPKDGSSGRAVGGTYLTVYARSGDGSVRVIRDTFNGLPG